MKIINHGLSGLGYVLKQIDRMILTYYEDLEPYKNMRIEDFFNFIKNISYKADELNSEVLRRPNWLFKYHGDCDCKTIACCCYFLIRKIPFGYAIVSDDKNKDYHHIFPYVIKAGERIDFDATYPENKSGNIRFWGKRKNYDWRY